MVAPSTCHRGLRSFHSHPRITDPVPGNQRVGWQGWRPHPLGHGVASLIDRRPLALIAVLTLFFLLAVDQPLLQALRGLDRTIFAQLRLITRLEVPRFIWCRSDFSSRCCCSARRAPQPAITWHLQAAAFLAASIAGSGLLVNLAKLLVGRGRPRVIEELGPFAFEPFSFSSAFASFPSRHANTLFALAMAMVLLGARWRLLIWSAACWLALSRVLVGAHFLADVIGGAGLGILTTWALGAWFVERGLFFTFARDGSLPPCPARTSCRSSGRCRSPAASSGPRSAGRSRNRASASLPRQSPPTSSENARFQPGSRP
jgi:undecaprenyl-diphosphatase